MLRVMRAPFCQSVIALALVAGCAKDAAYVSAPASPAGYQHPYHVPLSTPGARFGGLPPVVQNAVRSEAGTAEIIDARKEMREGRTFYKISFRDSGNFPPLYVGPDGSVLNPDLTVAVPAPQALNPEVKLADLPLEVRKVIQERPSGAEIACINQETWGDHTVYVVSFKEEAHRPKMYVIADGTVLVQPPK